MKKEKKKEVSRWDAGSTSSQLFRQDIPVNCATCTDMWNEVEPRPNNGAPQRSAFACYGNEVNNLKNYLLNYGYIDSSMQIHADEFW